MKAWAIIAIVVATSILASGCSQEKVQPQEWWDENPAAAQQQLVECNSMAESQKMASTNCARALSARLKQANSGTAPIPPLESWVNREKEPAN